jgi:hypothetical protein
MEQNFDALPPLQSSPASGPWERVFKHQASQETPKDESVESLAKARIAAILAFYAQFLHAPKRHKIAFCVKKTISTCLNQIHFVNALSVTSVSGFGELDKRGIVGNGFAVLRQVRRQHLDLGSKNARSPH